MFLATEESIIIHLYSKQHSHPMFSCVIVISVAYFVSFRSVPTCTITGLKPNFLAHRFVWGTHVYSRFSANAMNVIVADNN